MADFSYLQNYKPTSDARPFKLKEIELTGGRSPVLMLRCSAETQNPEYFNASSKLRRKYVKVIDDLSGVDAAMINDIRNMDRRLYAEHVVTGWTDVVDSQGKEVLFSVVECEAFLRALPDNIFDRARAFAGDLSNYTDVPASMDVLAGN